MSRNRLFGIGELSRRTECHIETIRFYEREGLLRPPRRSPGGHRLFDEDTLRRLVFIRRARELGFSMRDIRQLLGLQDGGTLTCSGVKSLAVGHLHEIRAKLRDLNTMRRMLSELVARCSGKETPACPIIDALNRRPLSSGKPSPPTARGGRARDWKA